MNWTGRVAAALLAGIALQILGLFGNQSPLPFVRNLLAPEYVAAREGYQKLARDGLLVEGDPGFREIRKAYMDVSLVLPELPIPLELIEGATVTRFQIGINENPEALQENTPVFGYYSTGEPFLLDFNYVMSVANEHLSGSIVLVNLIFLVSGCGLVYYAFRELFPTDVPSWRSPIG